MAEESRRQVGLIEQYTEAESLVAELTDAIGADELRDLLFAKAELIKIRRTIDNLMGYRMASMERNE